MGIEGHCAVAIDGWHTRRDAWGLKVTVQLLLMGGTQGRHRKGCMGIEGHCAVAIDGWHTRKAQEGMHGD